VTECRSAPVSYLSSAFFGCETRVLLGTQKSMDKIAQKKLNNGMYLFMKIGKLQ
jgi:hypothetical protein